MSDRVNARFPKPLAYNNHSIVEVSENEYLPSQIYSAILEGFEDVKEGRYFESTGDWKKDKELFKQKETEGWK